MPDAARRSPADDANEEALAALAGLTIWHARDARLPAAADEVRRGGLFARLAPAAFQALATGGARALKASKLVANGTSEKSGEISVRQIGKAGAHPVSRASIGLMPDRHRSSFFL